MLIVAYCAIYIIFALIFIVVIGRGLTIELRLNRKLILKGIKLFIIIQVIGFSVSFIIEEDLGPSIYGIYFYISLSLFFLLGLFVLAIILSKHALKSLKIDIQYAWYATRDFLEDINKILFKQYNFMVKGTVRYFECAELNIKSYLQGGRALKHLLFIMGLSSLLICIYFGVYKPYATGQSIGIGIIGMSCFVCATYLHMKGK